MDSSRYCLSTQSVTQDATTAPINHIAGSSHLQNNDSHFSGKVGSSGLKIFFVYILCTWLFIICIFVAVLIVLEKHNGHSF